MIGRISMLAATLLVLTGCAVRLGGPKPVEYRTVALTVAENALPGQVAAYIRKADANVVLLSAAADSAWFAEVARESELTLSGPGTAGAVRLAFLASEPVGDTTVALALPDGGEVVVHDALYRIDKSRYLDLLAMKVPGGVDTRSAVRELLRYIASDVMTGAAVVLAIDVPDEGTGDRIAELLDPAFQDTSACLSGETVRAATPGMRLFFGPEARLRCRNARLLGDGDSPVVAELVVGR